MSPNSYPVDQAGSTFPGLRPLTSDNPSGLDDRQWNALVGIVTAIVGNILISFALNLQRYAHIRINRENATWEMRGKGTTSSQYGTQARIAEERSRTNLKTPMAGRRSLLLGNEYDESTPLRHELRQTDDLESAAESEDGDNEAEQQQQSTNYLKSPWWWAGITLMTTGEAGNFLAYGFAPASIVSPLGVVALISNCIIAPCLLKERFRQRDFWGVLVAIAGVVTLVLSAKNSEDRMGPTEIWSSITRWEFELYLGLTAAAMLSLVWASTKYGEKTILIDVGLVALFGGYTALSTKGIASLLSDQLWLTLTYSLTYLLVFVLVCTAVLQIRYLNRALSRFSSTQVIPTQFVMFTISVIVGSAVLYRDFESADGERVGKFIGGCILTFLGVYLITSGRSSDNGVEGEDVEADEGQEIGLVDEEPERDGLGEQAMSPSPWAGEEAVLGFQDISSRRSSQPPTIRPTNFQRLNSAKSNHSRPFTPPSPAPDSPLIENPWPGNRDMLDNTPSPHTTSSSLPSQTPEPSTPKANHRPRLSMANRASASHRRSLANIFPGPISSPLSSSFTGIVADARRREHDTSSGSKRPRQGMLKTKSSRLNARQSSEQLQRNPPSAPTVVTETAQESVGRPIRARSQSLSNALGSFFSKDHQKSHNAKADETHER